MLGSWSAPLPAVALRLSLGRSLALSLGLGLGLGLAPPAVDGDPPPAALKTIDEEAIEGHVAYLASPELEGRDSPSVGLTLAAEHIAGVFAAAGLAAAPGSAARWADHGPGGEPPAWSLAPGKEGEGGEGGGGTFLWPFRVAELSGRGEPIPFRRPVPERCALECTEPEGVTGTFRYGVDFVPLARFPGDVRGELVWAGFGIQNTSERYDDFRGVSLKDRIALVLEGEPRHRRKFKGEEVTAESAIWNKLDALAEMGARGVVLVRRERAAPKRRRGADGEPAEPTPLAFRYTYASWAVPTSDRWRGAGIPGVEVSAACASALLGRDVEELARRIDRSGRPLKVKPDGRTVSFRTVIEEGEVLLQNVLGWLPGSDPALAEEVVVVGAHYDHIGVGLRGRVGYGADDNASGTAGLLEIVQALVAARPRRSVLFCAFAAEEDGMIGSRRLAQELPVSRERVVAMVNLDMIGRGDPKEVVCMGFAANPAMRRVVKRAKALARTGVRKLSEVDEPGLFRRSDHFSFHEVGIPVVFFLEGYPLEKNKDYHTWRDVPDQVDATKVAATARLAFLTAWILATDDERLPAPER